MSVGNFKVGDKARVKKNLEIDNYYGDQMFVESMNNMLGKIVTISKISVSDMSHCRGYRIEEDDGEFYYTDEMLEPINLIDSITNKRNIAHELGGRKFKIKYRDINEVKEKMSIQDSNIKTLVGVIENFCPTAEVVLDCGDKGFFIINYKSILQMEEILD